ncbi:MAG: DUF1214 domain-containing protein [Methylocella sp.]
MRGRLQLRQVRAVVELSSFPRQDAKTSRENRKTGLRESVALIGKFLLVGCAGVLLGLCITFATLQHGFGFGAVTAGPWTAWPKSGAGNFDPYARAGLAHSGELPMGASEGVSFIAHDDSAGAAFDANCDYTVSGETPKARHWTLTLLSPGGALLANAADRNGFTSSEILRSADGGFTISLSRSARPGNWLPIGAAKTFILDLRLYETELSPATVALDAANLPTIIKGACR